MFLFKHKNKPLLLYEFCILLSTETTLQRLKMLFFTLNSENSSFFEKFSPEGLAPCNIDFKHFVKVYDCQYTLTLTLTY